MLLICPNVSNFTQNLNDVFLIGSKFDEGCWNSQMILVHLMEMTILPKGRNVIVSKQLTLY